MSQDSLSTHHCDNCSAPLVAKAKFCGSCGASIKCSKNAGLEKSVYAIIAFYVAFLVLAIVNNTVFATDYSFTSEVIIEVAFIVITLGFCFLDWRAIIRLYIIRDIDVKGILMTLLIPIGSAVVVYYGIDWINEALGEYGDSNMFAEYVAYENSLFWAIFFIAILPPIFEELAFRGFLFNELRKVSSVQVTIIGTSFLFALVHFSLISFIWIFPFGIFLGYLRQRYQTLWLGMIVHFIHNFLVLMLDYYFY
ncbi:CPBP family intramembrane glutamic endopeptidase [Dokdonia sp.]|uniref:CPBP family intramembrane glutamic endopeptidase n=1 Tax=Dokdonia sp. TaxID=2024995 RepID=UPI0032638643